jgi:hypothetical protein
MGLEMGLVMGLGRVCRGAWISECTGGGTKGGLHSNAAWRVVKDAGFALAGCAVAEEREA